MPQLSLAYKYHLFYKKFGSYCSDTYDNKYYLKVLCSEMTVIVFLLIEVYPTKNELYTTSYAT